MLTVLLANVVLFASLHCIVITSYIQLHGIELRAVTEGL